MAVTTVLGALLILFGIGFAISCQFRKTSTLKNPTSVVLGTILMGVALLFSNRITEVTIPAVGTIKAAAQRATIDAATISALKQRVENQSATVDLVAAKAVAAQKMAQEAEAQTRQAEQHLSALNIAIMDATSTLNKLKAEENIVRLIVAAQNDDRHAYDELQKISGEKDNPFSTLAANAWLTISNAHSAPFFETPLLPPWRPGVDPAKFSFDDLKHTYGTIPVSFKPALLEYISQRKDIPKVEKMKFFLRVMKTDPSLMAVEYAGRYFEQQAGLNNIKAMALPYFLNWWRLHKKELTQK